MIATSGCCDLDIVLDQSLLPVWVHHCQGRGGEPKVAETRRKVTNNNLFLPTPRALCSLLRYSFNFGRRGLVLRVLKRTWFLPAATVTDLSSAITCLDCAEHGWEMRSEPCLCQLRTTGPQCCGLLMPKRISYTIDTINQPNISKHMYN